MPPLTAEQRAQLSAAYKGITDDTRVQLANCKREPVRFRWEPVAHSIDIEHRRVTTPIMTAYEMNLNGWRILPEEIQEALYGYMANFQVVGRMHTGLTNSYPVGAWFDGYQAYLTIQVVDDQDWADICNGVYKGTSWAGLAEVVEIPDDLAAAIGIAPGTWLFNILMAEVSFVDVPAVQAATFNSASNDMWAEETGTLVSALMLGTVKPRKLPGMPKDMMQPSMPRNRGGILGMLQQFITSLSNTLPPGNGQSTSSEDTDMGLTPEEREELNQLSQTVETLASSIADLVKAQNAANETTEDTPPAEDAPEAPPALTLDDLNTSIANAVAPLLEKITALENAPAGSAMIREVPVTTQDAGEAISALSANDPRRKAAIAGL